MIAKRHFEYRETAVTIIAPEEFIPLAEEKILEARGTIESWIATDDFFRDTFEPYDAGSDVPAIIEEMCCASIQAGVGPMASVAGAIAQYAVRAMVQAGCDHCLVDNGGDIAMFLSHPVLVGLYAGRSTVRDLALEVDVLKEHISICTSSGRIGPSISLGNADLATVISENGALADACATLLGNLARDDDQEYMRMAVERVLRIEGIRGCILVMGDRIAMGGDVPKLRKGRSSDDHITKVEFDGPSA